MLYLDFHRAKPAESLALIESFQQAMLGRAQDSVLLLTNVTDATYEGSIATRWKAARMQHAQAIRASAVYGLSGLVGMAVRGVIDTARLLGLPMTEGQLRVFADGEEARQWLSQQ